MKYLLFAFLMAITLNFTTYGCGKIEPVKVAEQELCTSPTSCSTRPERLVCNINELTKNGKIQWQMRTSSITKEHYYVLGINGDALFVNKGYAFFTVQTPKRNGTSIEVNNKCAIELFQYLEDNLGSILEDETQKAILDFLDNAERQYGTP